MKVHIRRKGAKESVIAHELLGTFCAESAALITILPSSAG